MNNLFAPTEVNEAAKETLRKSNLRATARELLSLDFERVIVVDKTGGVCWAFAILSEPRTRDVGGRLETYQSTVVLKATRSGVIVAHVEPYNRNRNEGFFRSFEEFKKFLRDEGMGDLISTESAASSDQTASGQ